MQHQPDHAENPNTSLLSEPASSAPNYGGASSDRLNPAAATFTINPPDEGALHAVPRAVPPPRPPPGSPPANAPVSAQGGLSRALCGRGAGAHGGHGGHGRGRGNQRINANFLLGGNLFQSYQEGGAGAAAQAGARGRGRGSRAPRRPARAPAAFNRDLFVLANSRFVLSDASDIASHGLDPDRAVDWGDVAQVTVLVPAPIQCPISLDTPPR